MKNTLSAAGQRFGSISGVPAALSQVAEFPSAIDQLGTQWRQRQMQGSGRNARIRAALRTRRNVQSLAQIQPTAEQYQVEDWIPDQGAPLQQLPVKVTGSVAVPEEMDQPQTYNPGVKIRFLQVSRLYPPLLILVRYCSDAVV